MEGEVERTERVVEQERYLAEAFGEQREHHALEPPVAPLRPAVAAG